MVVVPSYSVADALLACYAPRIPALEHRQLVSLLALPRVPGAQIIFVTSLAPTRTELDYYVSLVPSGQRRDLRARLKIVEVPDRGARSISAKLLERPELMARIRGIARHELAYIEPYNVTSLEMDVARHLDMPLNGTDPSLWPLGFKSNGRRVMRSAGVPVPFGYEDARSPEGVVAAARAIRRQHPDAAGVVVKCDNSGTGVGNRVIRFSSTPTTAGLRTVVASLDPDYLADIRLGAVVEELLVGAEFASPSVQVDIGPGGQVEVLSTHEQLVGGRDGQTYLGCRFPANRHYAQELAGHGEAVGRVLADRGALGCFSVDFAAIRQPAGAWELHGLEINLRKGGTNHPLSLLQNLVPGRYDDTTGNWVAQDGAGRWYRSTDGLPDPALRGSTPEDVVRAIRSEGLGFTRRTGTGVVLHMFSALAIDGGMGLTAIGSSPEHAETLYDAAVATLSGPVPAGGLALPA